MDFQKKNLFTVQQIDGTSIKTPHGRELDTIARSILTFLPHQDERAVEMAIKYIGGTFHNIGFGETFTMSFEYFPEVRIHVVYFKADEEDLGEADVKFFFSGDRVAWVSSEDLASLADLTMDYLRETLIHPDGYVDEQDPSDLLQRSILQRMEPFSVIRRDDLPHLAKFIGASLTANEGTWRISREFFPGITIIQHYDGKSINFTMAGKNLRKINNYAKDQLAIFMMNHCLRFIQETYTELDLPDIVEKAFSFSYLRNKK